MQRFKHYIVVVFFKYHLLHSNPGWLAAWAPNVLLGAARWRPCPASPLWPQSPWMYFFLSLSSGAIIATADVIRPWYMKFTQ